MSFSFCFFVFCFSSVVSFCFVSFFRFASSFSSHHLVILFESYLVVSQFKTEKGTTVKCKNRFGNILWRDIDIRTHTHIVDHRHRGLILWLTIKCIENKMRQNSIATNGMSHIQSGQTKNECSTLITLALYIFFSAVTAVCLFVCVTFYH